jgi:hypothetical protein
MATTLNGALTTDRIAELLGDQAELLLNHRSTTIDASLLHLPTRRCAISPSSSGTAASAAPAM